MAALAPGPRPRRSLLARARTTAARTARRTTAWATASALARGLALFHGPRGIAAPLAPAAGVKRRGPEAGEFHRDHVRHRAHAAAAVMHDALRVASREQLFEFGLQLRRRLEAAVGAEVLPKGPVQRTGDMAGDRV